MKQTEIENPNQFISAPDAILAFCWLALFGGRWVLGNFLVGFGVVSLSQLEEWDNSILEKCYLILFALTVISVCLRRLRQESDKH